VTAGAVGLKNAKADPQGSADKLVQVNTHYHEGAEHFSDGEPHPRDGRRRFADVHRDDRPRSATARPRGARHP
jgi:hypothetical protein